MKDMEGFLNCSILDEIFETRQEEFSHKVIETSEDYMKLREETETRLKSILLSEEKGGTKYEQIYFGNK